VDLDPLGCGLGVVLGQDSAAGLTWDSVSAGVGRIPALSLQAAVGQVHGISLLGWDEGRACDLAPGVAGSVVDAARLCTPVTIVDLARATSAAQREVLARCDRALVVVPADVRSVRAATRMTARLPLSMAELIVRGPNPGGLVAEDVGEAVGLPVLAAVAAERDLDRRLERGEPPGARARSPLGRAGSGILQEVLT
jgi:secretion/DNA translocation related CpaE-like protein